VKGVAYYRENRMLDGDLSRCGKGKTQGQEVTEDP
jgi:hypothetical protein